MEKGYLCGWSGEGISCGGSGVSLCLQTGTLTYGHKGSETQSYGSYSHPWTERPQILQQDSISLLRLP